MAVALGDGAMARKVALTIILLALLFSAVAGTLSAYATETSWVSKAPMHGLIVFKKSFHISI